MAGRHHVEPGERIRFVAGGEAIEGALEPLFRGVELAGEGLRDFGADFVAAGADAWAHRGDDVGGARAETHAHLAESFLRDARERAAPTAVHGGDGSAARVDEKEGDAIGGLHGEPETGDLCDEGVGARRIGWEAAIGDDVNHIGVKLARGDQRPIGGAERGGETGAPRGDGGAGIRIRES